MSSQGKSDPEHSCAHDEQASKLITGCHGNPEQNLPEEQSVGAACLQMADEETTRGKEEEAEEHPRSAPVPTPCHPSDSPHPRIDPPVLKQEVKGHDLEGFEDMCEVAGAHSSRLCGCSTSSCEDGCEKRASEVVKGVHAKLRRKLKEGNLEIRLG